MGILIVSVLVTQAQGAQYQWDFSGNLNSSIGSGVLTYADPSSNTASFGISDGGVPHMNGQPTTYIRVPAFTTVSQGLNVEFTATGPNGGGDFVNQYTMIFDVLINWPINWTPFFNTSPTNANDADFYVAPDASLGIAALGYSEAGEVATNEWLRIALAVDLGAGYAAYYIDGTEVFALTGESLLDGRFALYSNADEGHDLRLFNEGDTSGTYTHVLYVSSFFMEDRTLSAAEILALGGPDADGIFDADQPQSADYNQNGVVDAADYAKWRDTLGSTTDFAADGNGNSVIDAGDYNHWRAAFGASGTGANAAVPEPGTIALGIVAALCGVLSLKRAV